jgi:hypothetical protein
VDGADSEEVEVRVVGGEEDGECVLGAVSHLVLS